MYFRWDINTTTTTTTTTIKRERGVFHSLFKARLTDGRQSTWSNGRRKTHRYIGPHLVRTGNKLHHFVHRCCSLFGCLTSQQHASVSQGRICSDKLKCCNTEIEVVDPTFFLTQSQYTDAGSTSPSTGPISQGTTGVPILVSLVCLDPEKSPWTKRESNPGLPFSRRTP